MELKTVEAYHQMNDYKSHPSHNEIGLYDPF